MTEDASSSGVAVEEKRRPKGRGRGLTTLRKEGDVKGNTILWTFFVYFHLWVFKNLSIWLVEKYTIRIMFGSLDGMLSPSSLILTMHQFLTIWDELIVDISSNQANRKLLNLFIRSLLWKCQRTDVFKKCVCFSIFCMFKNHSLKILIVKQSFVQIIYVYIIFYLVKQNLKDFWIKQNSKCFSFMINNKNK